MPNASPEPTAAPRRSATARTGIILAAAIAAGTLTNLLSPRRLPWVQDWSHYVEGAATASGLQVVNLAQTRALMEEGMTTIFDARPITDYNAGHLPGALPFPSDAVDEWLPQYLPMLLPSEPILVYCSGMDCDESLQIGNRLHEQGFTNILIFVGGYSAWSAAALNTGGENP